MPLHPELIRFQHRLEASGSVVVAHRDHLCLRLSLLSSVRVRFDGERLSFDPRFGALGRTAATASTFGTVNVVVLGMVFAGVALPALVAAGTVGVLAGVYDIMRYIVTEGAIGRVTLLWSARTTSEQAAVIGAGPARAMAAEADNETVDSPYRVE